MKENPHLHNIISRIVNGIAMQFPVQYICSIIFYAGKKKIGDCAWPAGDAMYSFPSGTPAFDALQHKVEVRVIDMDGAARTLCMPLGAFM